MRLAVEDHPVTEVGPCLADLADHMHQVHHVSRREVRANTIERLELLHADDHDDLRGGCG